MSINPPIADADPINAVLVSDRASEMLQEEDACIADEHDVLEVLEDHEDNAQTDAEDTLKMVTWLNLHSILVDGAFLCKVVRGGFHQTSCPVKLSKIATRWPHPFSSSQ